MKKRRILLGLALASLFTFSLTACGDDAEPTTPPASEGGEGEGGTTPEVQKYDVKFMNGTTELTDLKQTVDKNAKATKPAKDKLPTATGKRFDFWSADGGVTAYNFDDVVTDNVTLEAVFADANEYDTLAASDKKIVATDFYNETVKSATGVSFQANAVEFSSTNAENKFTSDNKFDLKKDALAIDFGDKKISTSGILTVYFEMSFVSVTNGEAFFQLDGTSTTEANTEVFGLRVTSGDNKGKFGFRVDRGSDVASTITAETNKTYKVKLVFDTADAKASISLDGTTLANDIDINFTAIRGIKFTAKNTGVSEKLIDNVVATFETKAADPVVTAKAEALEMIDNYKASAAYTAYSDDLKAYIDDQITLCKKEVNEATTVARVDELKEQITTFISLDKYTVTVTPYSAANTPITTLNPTYVCVVSGYTSSSDITTQLNEISFTGYTVVGVYTDAALTTAATAASVVKGAELYVKLEEATLAGSWSAADLTVTAADADKTIAAGTQLTSICSTVGTVKCKLNGDKNACIGYEISQNGNGSIKIEVPTGKTVTVTLLLRSTSSSNTSVGIGVYNGTTPVVPTSFTRDSADTTSAVDATGVITIKGTKDATVVYSLSAGTYSLMNNADSTNNRGFRVYSITVA